MSDTGPSSFRLIATLGLAGLASGLVLVGVFMATEAAIQENKAELLRGAIFRVLPGTEVISPYLLQNGELVAFEGDVGQVPEGDVVYRGETEDGQVVGYAIPASGPGFMDVIGLIYGFDPERRVIVGMEVLQSTETPGLGDGIIKDDQFLANFEALQVDPTIVGVKRGEKSEPNQVDTITGATISSIAVINILNNSMSQWLPLVAPSDDAEQEQ